MNFQLASLEITAPLIEKCQENRWLRKSGIAWQDEGGPYEIYHVRTYEELIDCLLAKSWRKRQGIAYEDLAMIQCVDYGDDWWTLKQSPVGSWIDFECLSLHALAENPTRFNRTIVGMEMASVDQCQRLVYTLEDRPNMWHHILQGSDSTRVVGTSVGHLRALVRREANGGETSLDLFNARSEHLVTIKDLTDSLSAIRYAECEMDYLNELGIFSPADLSRLQSRGLAYRAHVLKRFGVDSPQQARKHTVLMRD